MSADGVDRTGLVAGAVAGLAAWLVGYAVTYLLVAPELEDTVLNRAIEALEGEPATWELAGWVFYNAHFVDTVVEGIPVLESRATNFVGGEDGFAVFLFAIPVALLLIAGFVAGLSGRADDVGTGVLAGLTVVPGYLLAAVAGVFLFEVQVAGASGAPDLLPAVVLAGLVYPVVCGGLGGAVASLAR